VAIKGARVHLFGMAYKPEVGDVRESPALDIAELLIRRGAVVSFSDPFVSAVHEARVSLDSQSPEEALAGGIDCAVITTHHSQFDYQDILQRSPVVVDTRNALAEFDSARVFRL